MANSKALITVTEQITDVSQLIYQVDFYKSVAELNRMLSTPINLREVC